jgi:transcriptional regulator of arginine metabolism
MLEKPRRQQRLLQLINSGPVTSQEQLAGMLRAEGHSVTQATLSRDLRELGVMKGPAGYAVPEHAPATTNGDGELSRALRTYLVRAETGGNLAILHTGPGRAALLALELDRARLKPVVGTIAGDDTIFVATRTPKDAGKVVREIRKMAGMK